MSFLGSHCEIIRGVPDGNNKCVVWRHRVFIFNGIYCTVFGNFLRCINKSFQNRVHFVISNPSENCIQHAFIDFASIIFWHYTKNGILLNQINNWAALRLLLKTPRSRQRSLVKAVSLRWPARLKFSGIGYGPDCLKAWGKPPSSLQYLHLQP
jgi:hypothetical protein